MADFDVEHAIGLMAGADGVSEMEAEMAFQATRTYLRKHGKSFMDLIEAKPSERIIDMQLQPKVDELEAENRYLRDKLQDSNKSLRSEVLERQKLQGALLLTKAKKYLAATLVSAFAGATSVGTIWGANHAREYLDIRNGLQSNYDKMEEKRKVEHGDLIRSLNAQEGRLEQNFNEKEGQLRTQLDKEKQDFFNYTKKKFNATLSATQPFRVGTGRYAYYRGNHDDDFGSVYADPPNEGSRNLSSVLAKVANESCLIVTGLVANNEEWVAVTQIIEGQRVSGYMELKNVHLGEVGPKVDCTVGKAIVALQPAIQ